MRGSLVCLFRTVEHLGWILKKREKNHWKALYRGKERNFTVHLSFDGPWVYFQMPLLPQQEVQRVRSPLCRELLYRQLLRLNEQMFWARFCLDGEEVLLLLDAPLETFDANRFRKAVEGLAAYASEFCYEVQILADLDRDPTLAQQLAVAERTPN
jgi:hypothetical protein